MAIRYATTCDADNGRGKTMIAMEMVADIIEDHANDFLKSYIGQFHCTAYAYTGSPTASGVMPKERHTVACNSLPFGTKIYIEGVGEFVVEDRGASWHQDNWLDIYMGDVESCYEWGNQERGVYIIDYRGD